MSGTFQKGTLPNNTDCNTINTNSIYLLSADNTYPNRPAINSFLEWLITIKLNADCGLQIGVDYASKKFKIRLLWSSNWGSWSSAIGG